MPLARLLCHRHGRHLFVHDGAAQKGDHVVASRYLFGNTASWMNTLAELGAR